MVRLADIFAPETEGPVALEQPAYTPRHDIREILGAGESQPLIETPEEREYRIKATARQRTAERLAAEFQDSVPWGLQNAALAYNSAVDTAAIAMPGLVGMAQQFIDPYADLDPNFKRESEDAAAQLVDDANMRAQVANEVDPSFVGKTARGIGTSLGVMATAVPAVAAGTALGGPAGGVAGLATSIGAVTAGNSYARGLEAGLDRESAMAFAISDGAAEIGLTLAFGQAFGPGLEALAVPGGAARQAVKAGGKEIVTKEGAKTFFGTKAKEGFETLSDTGRQLVSELGEELSIEVTQTLNDFASGKDPEALEPEQLGQMVVDVVAQTAGLYVPFAVARGGVKWAGNPDPEEVRSLITQDVIDASLKSTSRKEMAKAIGVSEGDLPTLLRSKKNRGIIKELAEDQTNGLVRGMSDVELSEFATEFGIDMPEPVFNDELGVIDLPSREDKIQAVVNAAGDKYTISDIQTGLDSAKAKRADTPLIEGPVPEVEPDSEGRYIDTAKDLADALPDIPDDELDPVDVDAVSMRPNTEAIEQDPSEPGMTQMMDIDPAVEALSAAMREAAQAKDEALRAAGMAPKRDDFGGSGLFSAEGLETARKKGTRYLKTMGKRLFHKGGELPEDVFSAIIKSSSEYNAIEFDTKMAVRDYRRAVAKYTGGNTITADLDPALASKVNDVLHGREKATSLPKELQEPVARMRLSIDNLSRRLIKDGAIQGDLAATVSSRLGLYVHRSYRAFGDKTYLSRLKDSPEGMKIYNKAVRFFMTEGFKPGHRNKRGKRGMDRLSAEKQVEDMLTSAGESGSLIEFLANPDLSDKHSALMKRGKIPEALRMLLGEETDPLVNFAKTVEAQAQILTKAKMHQDIKEAGLGVFLFEEPNESGGVTYNKDINVGGETYQTSQEIKDAFDRRFNPEAMSAGVKAILRANAAVKVGKTIYSPMTQIRNIVGNLGFVMAQGHWRVGNVGQSISATFENATGWNRLVSDKKAARKFMRRMQELGVVHESARAEELMDVLRDADTMTWDQLAERTNSKYAVRTLQKAGDFAVDTYRAGDELFKVYGWLNERQRYAKAYSKEIANGSMSMDDIDSMAASTVRETYPTYSLVPELVKKLRRNPLLGPFTSFAYESARVQFATMRLIKKEMADPRTRGIAAQRAVGLLTADLGTYAVAKATALAFGIDGEEDEAARELATPPWSLNSHFLYLPRGKNGELQRVDLSYADPFSYTKKPIIALLRGEDWEESLFNAASEALDPYTSFEIAPKIAIEAAFGIDLEENLLDAARNNIGKPSKRVRQPDDSGLQRFRDSVGYFIDQAQPGATKQAQDVMDSFTGKIDDYGKSRSPLSQAFSMVGLRNESIDPPTALGFKTRDFKTSFQGAASSLIRMGNSESSDVTDDTLRNEYFKVEARRKKLFDSMSKKVEAAQVLGMSYSDIKNTLTSNGVSKTLANDILVGNYKPYKPGPTTLKKHPDRRALLNRFHVEALSALR